MVQVEEVLNGVTYKTVAAPVQDECTGCAFDEDQDGCDAIGMQCVVSADIIWIKKED